MFTATKVAQIPPKYSAPSEPILKSPARSITVTASPVNKIGVASCNTWLMRRGEVKGPRKKARSAFAGSSLTIRISTATQLGKNGLFPGPFQKKLRS